MYGRPSVKHMAINYDVYICVVWHGVFVESLCENDVHLRRFGSGANIHDIIAPLDTHYRTQPSLVKGAKLFYVLGVQSPCLTVVKQCRLHNGVVQFEFSINIYIYIDYI